MTQLSHDAFARVTLYRSEPVYTSRTCKNCGAHNETPKGTRYLYAYMIQADDNNRPIYFPNANFCSVRCFRLYNT